MFQSLIDNGSLVKVQDEKGNSYEDWGIFGGWTNNIGNLVPGKGYKVKVKKVSQLDILGTPSTFPFKIPLQTGWNIVGYPRSAEADAQLVVQQLIDRGTLIKVQDEKGNSLEDWGIFGGWTNNIGNFITGEGYKIKVRAKDTLTIYESYSKGALTTQNEMRPAIHFLPAFEGNGVDHMNINLVGLSSDWLQPGDELAVFDGGVCVGAVALQKSHIDQHTVSVPVSAADKVDFNGFEEGNAFSLKLWDNETGNEFNIFNEIVKGTSTFLKHETTFANLVKIGTTGFNDNANVGNEMLMKCYPNPFTEQITIEIKTSGTMDLDVKIYDLNGRVVRNLYSGNGLAGKLLIWDGKNDQGKKVASGSYYLKANENVEKLIFGK